MGWSLQEHFQFSLQIRLSNRAVNSVLVTQNVDLLRITQEIKTAIFTKKTISQLGPATRNRHACHQESVRKCFHIWCAS